MKKKQDFTMKQRILDILTNLPDNKHPKHIVRMDLIRELKVEDFGEFRDAINELVKSGDIKWGRTLNDIWFTLHNTKK